eukprot:6626094-Prymnesium_polylepis.1
MTAARRRTGRVDSAAQGPTAHAPRRAARATSRSKQGHAGTESVAAQSSAEARPPRPAGRTGV